MKEKKEHPLAMLPPETPVTVIDEHLLTRAKAAAAQSPRKRIILPLHKQGEDLLQRMLNVLQPGTYIRPHRHAAHRAESIVVLSGAIRYITFNDDGEVLQQIELKAQSAQIGVDTAGGIYHCFIALEPDTVLFEVKPGPYEAANDKEFAPWAPEEYSEGAGEYLTALS